jgi:hypothetical protein
MSRLMLSKFLLTLAVICGAALMLRRGSGNADDAERKEKAGNNEKVSDGEMRFAAYAFLLIMLGLGSVLFVQDWREAKRVVTITLYREGTSKPVVYEARKDALESRAFTTLDGIRVVVASDERMEVSGLAED